MMRSPVSLTRLRSKPGAKEVVYTRKGGHGAREAAGDERVDERREEGSATGAEAVPSTTSEGLEALGEETRAHPEPYDPDDPKWFTPAFKVRDEDSIARAKTLSGPRSPSGALMSAENPSIARPPPPSTRPLK